MLKAEPSRFDELRANHCCPGVEHWFDGRVEANLTRTVASLDVQEIASAPVHQYLYITIPKRVAAGVERSAEVRFEMPEPERLELDAATERLPYSQILAQMDAVTAGGRARLALQPGEEQAMQSLQQQFTQVAEANDAARGLLQLLGELEILLGAERFATYRSTLERRLEAAILRQVPALLRVDAETRDQR